MKKITCPQYSTLLFYISAKFLHMSSSESKTTTTKLKSKSIFDYAKLADIL